MTDQELKDKILKIIKLHEKRIKLMAEVKRDTAGAIDFGAYEELPEILLFKGIPEISDLFEKDVNVRSRDDEEYPFEFSLVIGKTIIIQLGESNGKVQI
jgi:hypothetical protein